MKCFLSTILLICVFQVGLAQKTIKQIQVFEGFLSHGFEESAFYELKDSSVFQPVWMEFDYSAIPDSISSQIFNNENLVFIKVEGKRMEGGGFGHLGAADSQITVSRIIEVDTTMNFKAFVNYK